jgi:hypothetical protein
VRAALVVAAALLAACGKKGPPLAPLNLVPDRPTDTSGRVAGDTVYLSVTVPLKNANGRGALALDHLEVYAVTVDAGATAPPNRELLTKPHIVATIPIKPPVDPDEAPDETAPPDARPAGGDKIVFAEQLTDAQTTPEVRAKPQPASSAASGSGTQPAEAGAMSIPAVPPLSSPESVPATGGAGGVVGVPPALPQTSTGEAAASTTESAEGATPPAAAAPSQTSGAGTPPAQAPAPKPSATVTRVYVVRGVAKKGRPGTPSARIVVPIVAPPRPPSNVSTDFGETSVTIKWSRPETATTSQAPLTYNVYGYAKSEPSTTSGAIVSVPPPLNPQPIETLVLEHGGAEPGKEQCFVVRTVETVASTTIESEPSAPACVTPVDRFAPAAPKGLAIVATTGAMNLIWDANPEPDVAGYLVLRGESPGDTLQPLTPEPIRETRFRDTTARAGVRYAYAIVAVDRTGNRSPVSARVEETAR